jgi:transcriptional regulator with XRE-family HTH domain
MDWKKIISDLSESGITQIAMAERCKCAQSTISEISKGKIKNPSFTTGFELVAMHSEVCGVKKAA